MCNFFIDECKNYNGSPQSERGEKDDKNEYQPILHDTTVLSKLKNIYLSYRKINKK